MIRYVPSAVVLAALATGCSEPRSTQYDGPKVDAFTGRLVHNGKPVSFPGGEQVTMRIFHEKSSSFGIPIQSDGTFKIGWMLIGKYSAVIERPPEGGKGGPRKYNVPGGFKVEEGKTDYTIELGPGWQN
jgi:hypothetical protein